VVAPLEMKSMFLCLERKADFIIIGLINLSVKKGKRSSHHFQMAILGHPKMASFFFDMAFFNSMEEICRIVQ